MNSAAEKKLRADIEKDIRKELKLKAEEKELPLLSYFRPSHPSRGVTFAISPECKPSTGVQLLVKIGRRVRRKCDNHTVEEKLESSSPGRRTSNLSKNQTV